jgi:hypothetical protein
MLMIRNLLQVNSSPWDAVQTCDPLADGVYWVTTAGHGGLMVESAAALAHLSPAARRHAMKWSGWFCFEEDCQCSIAFYERPDWFAALLRHAPTEEQTARNLQTVKSWEWQYYEAATKTTLQRGESYCKDEVFFQQDHAEDWITVAATSGTSWEPVPAGMVKVTAAIGGRNKYGQYTGERAFLVPAEEYQARGPHGFIVDPARHAEVLQPAA